MRVILRIMWYRKNWNEWWTFRDRAQLFNFHLVCGAGAAMDLGIVWLPHFKLGWYYMAANFFAIAVVTLWNYGLNLTWTWTRVHPQSSR